MTQTELLQLIEQAGTKGWTELDLSGQYLTTLPSSLGNLQQLQVLRLGFSPSTARRNYLTALPDWMAKLTNLQSLYLSDNKLTALPDWMAKLTNLQSLDLSYNKLTALPDWMAKLTNLQSLYLSSNKLTALPDWMAKLTNLQSLYLSDTKLTALPDWMADSKNLPHLVALLVGGSPLSVPPPEVLGEALTKDYQFADIQAIRTYFQQLQGATVYFYEAKLLIIGEGGAGKTSLARKLVEPNYELQPAEKSTEGIAIHTWRFSVPPVVSKRTSDNQYTVNIWDFGGQEIYFATHQFFLTKRSVYLLVADTRRQHTDFYTWLRMQKTFGEDSPILLIKNRNRQHGNDFTIENLFELRKHFPNLREPIEIDLAESSSNPGWQKFLSEVQEHLLELPHIHQPRPKTWVVMRAALKSDSRSIIKWSELESISHKNGINRPDYIKQFAEYAHNVGDILYFHDDPILSKFVILKPTWGLDAVYKVLDNKNIATQLGRFNLHDLGLLWDNPEYQDYYDQLLRLMVNFQLCYPLAEIRDTFIAPQLLSLQTPEYDWNTIENLQLRYSYPVFMPRGILSRAIVRLHRYIEDQRLVWRSGVVLKDDFARAELIELRSEKMIRIRVSGTNKRDLLMHIVRALDELHEGFSKLQIDRLVPCNCEDCLHRSEPHFFVLHELRERLANKKDTVECRKPPYNNVPILGMLSEIRLWEQHSTIRGDTIVNIDNIYHMQMQRLNFVDARGSVGMGIGEQAAPTVQLAAKRPELSAAEKNELAKLNTQKESIERPLRRRARFFMLLYVSAYLGFIFLITWLLHKLVVVVGWDKFEPLSWVGSVSLASAGPLLAFLKIDALKPAEIEQWLFERWRSTSFAKYGFDSDRYQVLSKPHSDN